MSDSRVDPSDSDNAAVIGARYGNFWTVVALLESDPRVLQRDKELAAVEV
jgi:hypothetical protein